MNTVFFADTDSLRNPELFETAYRLVDFDRQSKVDRIRFDKDKRLSLGAGFLLFTALCEYGLKPPFSFEQNEFGKPFLVGNKDVFFSLSHSGTLAMCAVSPVPIGVDVERKKEADLRIAKRFFHSEEYEAVISSSDPLRQSEMFFRIWTRKESYVKAIGKGLALPFESFNSLNEEIDGFILNDIETDFLDRGCQMSFSENNSSKEDVGKSFLSYKAAVCRLSSSPEDQSQNSKEENAPSCLNENYEIRIIDFEQSKLLQ